MTKKVLILIVIAMLALSVMALANAKVLSTNPYGSANSVQAGPTCSSSSLSVYSVIGIEQGFVATATSYDASFCGAPCNCNCALGPSISERLIPGTFQPLPDGVSGITGILLSKLTFKSNASTINVSVNIGPNPMFKTGGGSSYYYYYNPENGSPNLLGSYSGGSSQSFSLDLAGGSINSPYAGSLYVILDTTDTAWGKVVPPGDYTVATTFTISPQNTF